MPGKFIQLLLANALTCGLEICMATGTTYIPPLLLEAGLEEQFMTMVLGVGPMLGLVFVPMISSASDRWSGRFGRRRPFIWALCVGVLLGLLLIPHSLHLASLLPWHPRWLELLLLVASICLLEFCGQACFTPLEALVSDLFPGAEESQQAFSIYSLMLSLGGCVGYLLPVVDWHAWGLAVYLGSQEALIYALLTIILLLCLLSTTFISEELGATVTHSDTGHMYKTKQCCPCLFQLHPLHLYRSLRNCLSLLPQLYKLFLQVPLVIRRLFVAELCSWMALMTLILFYTDFIGEGLYQGVPTALPGTQERLRYDEGVRMGSLGLFLQGFTAVVSSLMMNRLVAQLGMRTVYLSSVVVLTGATLVMSLSSNIYLVTLMTMVTGFTFCTLEVLPYSLICLYHSNNSQSKMQPVQVEDMEQNMSLLPNSKKQIYSEGHPVEMSSPGHRPFRLTDPHPSNVFIPMSKDSLPDSLSTLSAQSRGLCLDMAILDSAYLLSHVVPSLFLGYIVQLTHSVTAYMTCATGFSVLAIYFSRWVIIDRTDLE
uniref:Solute carrier family 45 member 3 n=1 Tax=Paramormyrops kingsleyae TaxID=1676925 RepID=A0A3B3SYL7_9TELE